MSAWSIERGNLTKEISRLRLDNERLALEVRIMKEEVEHLRGSNKLLQNEARRLISMIQNGTTSG